MNVRMMKTEMMIMINDRGMMKYQGFFMTEHSELLKKAKRDYKRVEKPMLSQDQIEEFERLISESLQLHTELEITHWKDGFFEKELGQIKKVDQLNKMLYLQKNEDRSTIRFNAIIDIKSK
jgi:YolD-like protein